MAHILLHAQYVYAPGIPDATSLVIHDGTILWIGDRTSALAFRADVDCEIDFGDALIAPAFVDAHVHLGATGMQLSGIDLSRCTSAMQALDVISQQSKYQNSSIVFGHGWDDSNWIDRQEWTSQAVALRCDGRPFYFSRIDVHSAICSSDLTENQVHGSDLFNDDGIVVGKQHEIARVQMLQALTESDRTLFIQSALHYAASQGIAAVHEHAGPAISGKADVHTIAQLDAQESFPKVFTYWGSASVDEAIELSVHGVGGDLCVDGSLGSSTAWLKSPYKDAPQSSTRPAAQGISHLTVEQLTHFLSRATQHGIQAGVHAIGDAALDAVIQALRTTVEKFGLTAVRVLRHRIEHAEMICVESLEFLADCAVVLSVQPMFDQIWGGEQGMYATRLGAQRALAMNPFSAAMKAGVVLAFGSDSPVTAMNPWEAIRAAVSHHNVDSRISLRAAFQAHTRGGWRAVGDDIGGTIKIGAPAHLAIWDVQGLPMVAGLSEGTESGQTIGQQWSTDPRSGTPLLPDIRYGTPKALLTCVAGRAVFDPAGLWPNG